jgi:hypothetical protein
MWQVCSDSRIKPEINRDTRDNAAVFASCRHWGSASERQIWRLHGGACHELDPLTPTPKRPCKLFTKKKSYAILFSLPAYQPRPLQKKERRLA